MFRLCLLATATAASTVETATTVDVLDYDLSGDIDQLTFAVTNLLQSKNSSAENPFFNTTNVHLTQGVWDVNPLLTPLHGRVPATESGSTVPAFGFRAKFDPSAPPTPSPDNPNGYAVVNGSVTMINSASSPSRLTFDFEMIEHTKRKLLITRSNDLKYTLFNSIVNREIVYIVAVEYA